MQRSSYDVVIAGGGPAGCAAAITAKMAHPAADVLLLEKSSYPRHKVCGEFVSPETLGLLDALAGDSHEGVIQKALRISGARLLIGENTLNMALNPPAISLARYQLDALLWSAAQAIGVECVSNVTVQGVHEHNGFLVKVDGQDWQARSVVNAAGRWSNLSPSPPSSAKQKWIGLKAHFAEKAPQASVDLYFFPGGYCGVQPVGAESINACAMVRADVAADLSAVFEQHPALSRRSRWWQPLTQTFATAPLLFHPPQARRAGQFLVGDAAGFIDPFLGDGISLALRSGSLAGGILAEFCAGKTTLEGALVKYQDAYRASLAPAFFRASGLRRLLTMPALLRTPLLSLARMPGVAEFVFRKTRQLSGEHGTAVPR